jgi:hypothetical protein
MASYNSSVHALQRLLSTSLSSPSAHCRITKIPQVIPHMINGIEYCAIEITCDDGPQYGIQAYGEEAIELHKEALRHYIFEKEGRADMPLAYNIS